MFSVLVCVCVCVPFTCFNITFHTSESDDDMSVMQFGTYQEISKVYCIQLCLQRPSISLTLLCLYTSKDLQLRLITGSVALRIDICCRVIGHIYVSYQYIRYFSRLSCGSMSNFLSHAMSPTFLAFATKYHIGNVSYKILFGKKCHHFDEVYL